MSDLSFEHVISEHYTVFDGLAGMQLDRTPIFTHRLLLGVGCSTRILRLNVGFPELEVL